MSPFTADGAIQAYNYRFCLSSDANNRRLPDKPANYNREEICALQPQRHERRPDERQGARSTARFCRAKITRILTPAGRNARGSFNGNKEFALGPDVFPAK